MALQDRKLGAYADNVKSLSDYPSDDGVTAEQLKAIFDGRTDKEVKNAINGVIDDLTVSSGASEVRTSSGKSVQEELDLKVSAVSGKGLSTNDYTTAEKNKLAGMESGATNTVVDASLSSTSTNPVQNKTVQAALDTKVDKVSGKGLSTNDYTTAEKNKLAGVETGANKTVVDATLSSTSENPVQNKAVQTALDLKVDAVSGKGLSTNDYTTEEKSKLSGVEDGATNTVVDTALSSTSENPVQNKAVKSAIDDKADKTSPIINNKLYIQTGENNGTNPTSPYAAIYPAADGAYIEFSKGLLPRLKIKETGLVFDYDDVEYKVYSEYNKPPADTSLSSTSTNPVQNKVVSLALQNKANFENPGFIGDMIVQGGSTTSFIPKLTVSVDDSRASMSYESIISQFPDKILFGDGRLAFHTGGVEYDVYTSNNPPTTINGFSFASMTQAEYDALAEKDANTLYIVTPGGAS